LAVTSTPGHAAGGLAWVSALRGTVPLCGIGLVVALVWRDDPARYATVLRAAAHALPLAFVLECGRLAVETGRQWRRAAHPRL
jgi:hypothetical protein